MTGFFNFIPGPVAAALCTFLHIACADLAGLQPQLSSGATISSSNPPARWSEYHAPNPGYIVNVATEQDVATTVAYCNQNNIPFLAQNGGIGWSSTLDLSTNGVLINLAGLNFVNFSSDKTTVKVGGGAIAKDVINAGSNASALVATGTCNCVGALGSGLGGGLNYLQGQHGLIVDNYISMNVVLADGTQKTVTPAQQDLWFALRGAGPNFGIVTSAVQKAYPVNSTGLQAWTGALIFIPSQLQSVVSAINGLQFQPQMALDLVVANEGGSPAVIVGVFYYGTEAQGKAAFASLYNVGPVATNTGITPYTSWNSANDVACIKGGRKPAFGAGLAQMDPQSWQEVYDIWYNYTTQNPGAANTTLLMNAYPTAAEQQYADSSSAYPWRRAIKFFAAFNNAYSDPSFDATALAVGAQARAVWRSASGLGYNATYINNAQGDEDNEVVYGGSLPQLQALKSTYDPLGRFNEWFPISTPGKPSPPGPNPPPKASCSPPSPPPGPGKQSSPPAPGPGPAQPPSPPRRRAYRA